MEFIYLGFSITLFFMFFILTSGKIDYFSPLSLHVVSWFFVFFIGILVGNKFFPLTDDIFYSFMIWFLTLSVSFIIMYLSQGKRQVINYTYELKYKNIYFIFSILACVILLIEIFYVGMGGPYNFFLNLRLSLYLEEYEGVRYVLAPYFYLIMTPLFAISLICNKTEHLRKITTLWQILFIISTVGKLTILTTLIIYLIVKYTGIKKKLSIFYLSTSLIIFLMTSFFLHSIRKSEDSSSQSLIDMLGEYIFSPIIAFGELRTNNEIWGEYTFRFFYAVIYKLGLNDVKPAGNILDYVYIPSPVNVYTGMQPFYQDFGKIGLFYGALFYSIFYSLLYFKAIEKRGIYLVIYALVSISLVLFIFAETLVSNLALNLYLILFSIILWRTSVVQR